MTAADAVMNQRLCNGWEQIQLGDFIVENNIWGVGDAGAYNWLQCIELQDDNGATSINWSWDWPQGSGLVKGYPAVIYGDKFGLVSADKKITGLPRKISKIDAYEVSFAFNETEPFGSRNIALESWMHTSKKAAIDNVAVEMMVWIDRTETFNTWGTHLWDVEIDGTTFALYQTDEPGWSYIAFVATEKFQGNSLRWNSFVEHLIDTGLAAPTLYMANIEFGTELISGMGHFELKNYAIERSERKGNKGR